MSARVTASAAAAVALVAIVACRATPDWPPEPAPVQLGEDTCAACRMIITDERFGAQRHRRDGGVQLFDDLGCLLGSSDAARLEPEAVLIRSFADTRWIRGDRAYVVRARGLASPMGHGLAAFATSQAAEAEAARHAGATLSSFPAILGSGTLSSLPAHRQSGAGF